MGGLNNVHVFIVITWLVQDLTSASEGQALVSPEIVFADFFANIDTVSRIRTVNQI